MPKDTPLPIVEPFLIPSLGWKLTDFRATDPHDWATAARAWTQSVVRFTESQGIESNSILCQNDVRLRGERMDARFQEALALDPSLTVEEFSKTYSDPKPRFKRLLDIPHLMLAIEKRSEFIGAINVTQIRAEFETSRKITTTAMIWVGHDIPARQDDDPSTWTEAIFYMIDNDIRLADGRVLDIVGYDFVSDVMLKDRLASRPGLLTFLDQLGMRMDRQGEADPETGDIKFRRVQ